MTPGPGGPDPSRSGSDGHDSLRILMLNWKDPADPDAGGAERMVRRIAEVWAGQGHQVELFVPRRHQTRHQRIGGVTYRRAGNRATVFHSALSHLSRHADRYDRVVESVSTRPFFSHEIVGVRATALYHQMARDIWDLEYRFPLSWVGRRLLEPRWVRRMAGAQIVADSASTAADLAEYGLSCAALAAPGWDGEAIAETRAAPSANPRLLFMGRLVRHKRPADAIEALRQVRRVFPEATLDIIGDGYLRPSLEQRAEPGVTIHGYISEAAKADLLDSADILLVPCTREGWGIVAIEASSRGVPVVAYNVPGLCDSVADGHTGILCQPVPEAMATAVIGLLQDRGRWQALAAAGPDWARRFTWDEAAAVIMQVLRRPLPTPEATTTRAAGTAGRRLR